MYKKKYTIRNNDFDYDHIREQPVFIDEDDIKHSLNKNKNWTLLDNPNIKQIKYHRNVTGRSKNTALTNKDIPGSGTGTYYTYYVGRDFVKINNNRKNENFDLSEQKN